MPRAVRTVAMPEPSRLQRTTPPQRRAARGAIGPPIAAADDPATGVVNSGSGAPPPMHGAGLSPRRRSWPECLLPEAAEPPAGWQGHSVLTADGVDSGLAVLGEVFDTFNRLEAEAAKKRQLRIAQGGEHLRGVPRVGSSLIFAAGDIADVM